MLWEGEEFVGFVKGRAPKEGGSETERRESAVVKRRGERVCHFGSGRGCLRVESAILAVGEAACTSSRAIDFVEGGFGQLFLLGHGPSLWSPTPRFGLVW